MKFLHSILLLTAVALFAACNPEKEELFNGQNLDGWACVVDSTAPEPTEPTFSVRNGAIHITGTPFGYIRTEKKYANYTLHLEWRWAGGRKVDSGIFNFLQDGDKVWPRGVQFQMREEDFGFLMGGIPMKEVEGADDFYRKPSLEGSIREKPVGEWNECEFTCEKGHIEARMNDLLVNEAQCEAVEGYIGFQSEGGEIEFRNIYLVKH